MTILITVYLTGIFVSVLCNIIYTFGFEQPKEKYKYWLIIPESIFWFILFPIAVIIVLFLFFKRSKNAKL